MHLHAVNEKQVLPNSGSSLPIMKLHCMFDLGNVSELLSEGKSVSAYG